MQHFGTKRLETERLVLRPFVMGDAPAMYRNWASDPEVTKYLTWSAYSSEETAVAVLTEWTAMYPDPTFYQWAIELKSLGEPIGSISVVQYDDRAELAHIGYCIGKKWWNQGIMTEALREVMDYLFAEVGVNRVESQHDPNNPGSGAVMRKCGMRYEGTHRQSVRSNQGIVDACWYALLAEERK